ncbi:MAG: hypothetical protein U0987_02465 [Afipia sp.]|nr:hypothetical protein [Afipia sp.]
MRQKLFIHIGPHKTGTSSLQRFLFNNQKELLKRGVFYPIAGLGARHAQHRFAFSIRGKLDPKDRTVPTREAELEPLFADIRSSGADTAILSSEAFFATGEAEIRILHSCVREFDTVVVFYARRQDEGYISSYTQRSKSSTNRHTHPIHVHLGNPVKMGHDLDIHGHAVSWARVFGKENVVARLYSKNINVPEDFLHCIDERRGKGPVLTSAMHQFTTDKSYNLSPSLEATEMTRLFKMQCEDHDQRRMAFELLSKHLENGRPAAKLLSTADRRAILEFFRSSNEKLFREFFASENKFTPEQLLQGPETQRESLTIEDTAKIIVDMIAKQSAANRRSVGGRLRRAANRTARVLGLARRI